MQQLDSKICFLSLVKRYEDICKRFPDIYRTASGTPNTRNLREHKGNPQKCRQHNKRQRETQVMYTQDNKKRGNIGGNTDGGMSRSISRWPAFFKFCFSLLFSLFLCMCGSFLCLPLGTRLFLCLCVP